MKKILFFVLLLFACNRQFERNCIVFSEEKATIDLKTKQEKKVYSEFRICNTSVQEAEKFCNEFSYCDTVEGKVLKSIVKIKFINPEK